MQWLHYVHLDDLLCLHRFQSLHLGLRIHKVDHHVHALPQRLISVSSRSLLGAITTTGISASIRVSRPCLSSTIPQRMLQRECKRDLSFRTLPLRDWVVFATTYRKACVMLVCEVCRWCFDLFIKRQANVSRQLVKRACTISASFSSLIRPCRRPIEVTISIAASWVVKAL